MWKRNSFFTKGFKTIPLIDILKRDRILAGLFENRRTNHHDQRELLKQEQIAHKKQQVEGIPPHLFKKIERSQKHG